MGNPKQKWTAEEEEALRAGIAKYGAGKWKFIQRDPEFNKFLHSRSNIDLKDKWRNMSAAAGLGGSREKSKTPKPKTNQDGSAVPIFNLQPSASDVAVTNDATVAQVKDDLAKELPDAKISLRYLPLVYEALSSNEPYGMDLTGLMNYIEKRMEVPQNFRKQLGAKLRRLIGQDKLEKVENLYRIKSNFIPERPTLSTNDMQLANPQSFPEESNLSESLEAAARDAAYKIADAESKSYMAAEAVREAERIARMAEESDSILQFAEDIFNRCACGEVVLLA
ncbi:hypothetical protein Drorol1_Dr00005953 [Drosera rotundifolia]